MEPNNLVSVIAQLHYWWAGLLMFRTRHETNLIVKRGYRQAAGRRRCQNDREETRERSATAS